MALPDHLNDRERLSFVEDTLGGVNRRVQLFGADGVALDWSQSHGLGTRVSVTKRIPAAGNYSANDIVSDSVSANASAWTFTNLARALGEPFVIKACRLKVDSTALTVFLGRLHLFRKNPTSSELRDNVAKAWVLADMESKVGWIDLPLFTAQTVFAEAFNYDLSMEITPETDSRTLYGVLETLTAETNEVAGMMMTVALEVAYL